MTLDDRMKGGAVKVDRSPLKDAIDFRNALHDPLFWAGTPPASAIVIYGAICSDK